MIDDDRAVVSSFTKCPVINADDARFEKIEPVGFLMSLVKIIPTVLKHSKFSECTDNKDREIAHLLTRYGFIGCFIVTSIIFLVLYGSYLLPDGPLHGPWSQLNPIKWLANLSGIAIIVICYRWLL